MALFSPFGLMVAGDVQRLNQQALINQQNQQQINDALATDALNRQMAQQKLQDYLTGQQGAGAYWRSMAQGTPQIAAPVQQAPAPIPGQNSAQQPAPAGSPQQVDVPGAANMAQYTPGGGFANVTTPQQAQRGVDLGTMTPAQGAAIVQDMQRRGVLGKQFAAGEQANAPGMMPAPQAPQTQQGQQDVQGGLPTGTYGRVLALAQNNQVINLASRAAAQLIKTNPNMTDRQLALAMDSIYPVLSQQSQDALQLAGLSNTEMFKAVNVMLRQSELSARYPGLAQGGQSAYTPQQIATAADMLRNGQSIPVAMKPYVFAAYPDIAQQAMQGKAKQAAATVAATAGPKAEAAAQTASATAVPKAQSAALKNVQSTLSSLEPAYNSLETNFSFMLDTAKQYGLGPATPVNAVLNKLRQMSDPKYTQFKLALQAVQKEYGKVLTASTGARGVPVAAMREANDTLSPNMSLAQLQAAQQAMQTDGRNVLDSYRKQRDTLTQSLQGGAQPAAPSRSMSPEDQQALEWANANPNDPRAAKIKAHLGVQ